MLIRWLATVRQAHNAVGERIVRLSHDRLHQVVKVLNPFRQARPPVAFAFALLVRLFLPALSFPSAYGNALFSSLARAPSAGIEKRQCRYGDLPAWQPSLDTRRKTTADAHQSTSKECASRGQLSTCFPASRQVG